MGKNKNKNKGGESGPKVVYKPEPSPPPKAKQEPAKKEKKQSSPSDAGAQRVLAAKGAKELFSWLIGSKVTTEDFMKSYWEKKHLVVQRGDRNYYSGIYSREELVKQTNEVNLSYEVDVNAYQYVDGHKESMNGEGEFTAEEVEAKFEEGASLQVHHPQRFNPVLHALCYHLECYFHTLVGTNAYLTPPGTQGLAPHNDDVDVFILQLEGSKHWRLYAPQQKLARSYSKDLSQEEIGEPILDITLHQGDMLYFPRGTIHQADVAEGAKGHSTHLTISTYQRHSWCDYLGDVMSEVLDRAVVEDVDFRAGLPLDLYTKVGSGLGSDTVDKGFHDKVSKLATRLVEKYLGGEQLHAAADNHIIDFMRHRLPPPEAVKAMEELESEDAEIPEMPSTNRKLKLKYPDACYLMYRELAAEEDPENDSEDEDEMGGEEQNTETGKTETHAVLLHCVHNNPVRHMVSMPSDDEGMDSGDDEEDYPMVVGGSDDEDEQEQEEEEEEEEEEAPPRKRAKIEKQEEEEEEKEEDADDGEGEDEDGEGLEGFNMEDFPMMDGSPDDEGYVSFPKHFGPALRMLLTVKDYVSEADLPLESDDDRVRLTTELFTEGLAEVVAE